MLTSMLQFLFQQNIHSLVNVINRTEVGRRNPIMSGIDNTDLDPNYEDIHDGYKGYGARNWRGIVAHKKKMQPPQDDYHFDPSSITTGLKRCAVRVKPAPVRKHFRSYRKRLGVDNPLQFTREVMKDILTHRWPRFRQYVHRKQTKCCVISCETQAYEARCAASLVDSYSQAERVENYWNRFGISLSLKDTEVDMLRRIANKR
jgi:hypothetical protein